MGPRLRRRVSEVGPADPIKRLQGPLAQAPLVPVGNRQAAQRRPEPSPGVPGGPHHYVLQYRQATEQADPLQRPGDAECPQPMRPAPCELVSAEPDPPGTAP